MWQHGEFDTRDVKGSLPFLEVIGKENPVLIHEDIQYFYITVNPDQDPGE